MQIRPANLADMPACLDLVLELAIYERQPEAVTATLADYEQNFLAKTFDVIVVEVDEKIVGMALFYLTWSTWRGRMMYLEDFVVTESARKTGIGQFLFDAFLAKAKAEKCVLAKWQVLDWNEPAIRFYEKNQAIIEKDWWNGKLFFD
jgi:GNAT superfamily N-acetyltransferase